MLSLFIATFAMSDALLVFHRTKIGEISDRTKCHEYYVTQALGFLTRFCTAELRLNGLFWMVTDIPEPIDFERLPMKVACSQPPSGVLFYGRKGLCRLTLVAD